MSLKKNLLFNFILSFSQVAFPLISIPYISRVLDPAGIGKVGFIDSLTYYFIVIAEFGITTYAIREISRKKGQTKDLKILVSELVSLHIYTSLISSLLYVILLTIFYQKINDIRLVFFSLSFLLINSFACEWYFWGSENFKYITLRSLITRVLGLVSIFLLVKGPQDYAFYYGIIVGTAIINLVWNFFKMFTEVDLNFKNIHWRKHIPFVFITYKISLIYSVVIMLDNVFLQILSTSVAVAYYMFAAKVVRIASALITDTLLVFYPRTVSQVFKNENEAFQSTVFRSAQLIILTTIPISAGIFLLAEKLAVVYFGDAFLPLAADLKILALYPFLKAYSLFLNKQLLMPFDKEKLVLNSLWIGAVVFVCLTIPLSYFFADKGTSTAIMISELVVLAVNLYYVNNLRSGLKMFDWQCVLQALGGILLFFPAIYVIDAISSDQLVQLVSSIFVCICFYFSFLLLVKNDLIKILVRSTKRIV